MNAELERALDRVADRVRTLRLWAALALCWAAWAAVGLILIGLGVHPPIGLLAVMAVGVVASGVACWYAGLAIGHVTLAGWPVVSRPATPTSMPACSRRSRNY